MFGPTTCRSPMTEAKWSVSPDQLPPEADRDAGVKMTLVGERDGGHESRHQRKVLVAMRLKGVCSPRP